MIFLCDDGLLHVAGQVLEHLVVAPLGVEQEGAAFLDALEHVVAADVGRVVAGRRSRPWSIRYGALDRALAEAQVGDGDAARFLRVVGEVALGVHVGVVADDLDGVLVGADGAVRAEAPELAADGVALGSMSKSSSTGSERLVTSSLMPTVKSWKQAPSRWSKTALTMAGVNSLELRP